MNKSNIPIVQAIEITIKSAYVSAGRIKTQTLLRIVKWVSSKAYKPVAPFTNACTKKNSQTAKMTRTNPNILRDKVGDVSFLG